MSYAHSNTGNYPVCVSADFSADKGAFRERKSLDSSQQLPEIQSLIWLGFGSFQRLTEFAMAMPAEGIAILDFWVSL